MDTAKDQPKECCTCSLLYPTHVQLEGDGQIHHIGMVQYNQYFVIAWLHWEPKTESWKRMQDEDILEIIILKENVPVTIWERSP